MLDWITAHWMGLTITAVSFLGIVAVLFARLEKVGPNEVLIVSGRSRDFTAADGTHTHRGFSIIHGGYTFVKPWERADRMSLELMTLEIKTPEFYTKFGVAIVVDGIAQIKVRSDDSAATATAAEMFLSKSRDDLNQIAHQMMSGHLRGAISTLSFEEILSQPEAFAQRVQELTAEDLGAMGIQVVSFTIREIQDPSGYIARLRRPQQAEVDKNAVLGEAKATRDANIGKALAQREATVTSAEANKESQLATIQAGVAVAESEKNKDVKLRQFEAEVAQARAETDVAYDIQRAHAEQRLTAERLGISLIEKQKQIEVESSEIERRELELVHSVQKPAEAERLRIATLAEAERGRREQIAQAEAEAARLTGLAEAEVIRAKAMAEAEGIRMRGLAEAEGQRAAQLAEAEGMRAKAEAWREYNQAALSQILIEQLPEIARAVAEPLSKVERIVLVNTGGGDGVGFDRITEGITRVVAQVPALAELLTGIDLGELSRLLPGTRTEAQPAAPVATDAEQELVIDAKPAG